MQGHKPNGDNATTIFDLHHQHVVVYPATVDTYAVTIKAPAVRVLAATAEPGDRRSTRFDGEGRLNNTAPWPLVEPRAVG